MYVIIETGGKQYRLQKGETVRVERLEGEEGSQVTIGSVLAARTDEGFRTGQPRLDDARVTATILKHGRGPKIHIFKYKRRKGYHKKIGHRQDYTEIRIDQIAFGEPEPGAQATEAEPVAARVAEEPVEVAVEPSAAEESTAVSEANQPERGE